MRDSYRLRWVVLLAVLLAALLAPGPARALPATVEEFRAEVAERSGDPREAAKLWFEALYIYERDPALGARCITEMMADRNWQHPANRLFLDRLNRHAYIVRSYARGTSPVEGYRLPAPERFELEIVRVDPKPYPDREGGLFVKLFLRTTGAETPRPMTLRRLTNGGYRVEEYSSLLVGVRQPAAQTGR